MEGQQLALTVELSSPQLFANYHPGPNQQAVLGLRESVGDSAGWQYLLHGPSGLGKTHLLKAVLNEAQSLGIVARYLDLRSPDWALAPGFRVLCIDNLSDDLSDADMLQLVRTIDSTRACGQVLIIASAKPHTQLLGLRPDLRTRLSACISFGLRFLNDEESVQLLQSQAHARGLHIAPEIAQFIIRRTNRDCASLLAAIARLDHASLAQHRRLTIPFVQSVLAV